jgi:hypothetical protein
LTKKTSEVLKTSEVWEIDLPQNFVNWAGNVWEKDERA